jgi:ABC-type nitrate/sulfonate/bicarbonate transport system ATPase subunit
MTVALTAEQVAKRYGELEVLRDITFSVPAGRLCCILGPTGCGKSTLLRLLLGLEAPTGGRLAGPGDGSAPGVVFQRDALLPWRTVAENVALPLEVERMSAAQRRERVARTLDQLELTGVADRYPGELSGGARQFVALARALATEPRLLIMDEPFGHLDPITRLTMETQLLEWLGRLRTTVLFVTHNVEEAVFLGDTVVVLSDKPTVVVETVEVSLDRPRDPDDPAFLEVRRHLSELVQQTSAGKEPTWA